MAFELRDHNEPLLPLEELPGAVQRALEEFLLLDVVSSAVLAPP